MYVAKIADIASKIQRPLRDSKRIYQIIKLFYTPTNPEILVKIGPLDSEIPGLEINIKN